MKTQVPAYPTPAAKPFKKAVGRLRPLKLLTYGAFAAVLLTAPVSYNTDQGGFVYNSAWASSCFTPDTLVMMGNGQYKRIDEVRPGDYVIGEAGRVNRVTEIERVPLAGRKLFSINGSTPFVTAEHPFRTPTGWGSFSPLATAHENPKLRVSVLTPGDRVMVFDAFVESVGNSDGALATAVIIAPQFKEFELQTVEMSDGNPEDYVFNLLLDGNHTYIANDFLVHNKGGDDSGSDDSSSDSGSSGSDSSGSSSSGSDDSRDDSRDDDRDDRDDRDDWDDDDRYDDSQDGSRRSRSSDDSDYYKYLLLRRGSGLHSDDFNEQGLKLRGDGSIDDSQPGISRSRSDDFNAQGLKLRGDGSIDDSQPGTTGSSSDDLNAQGLKLRGDGSVDDSQPSGSLSRLQSLNDGTALSGEQERNAIQNGWQ